jgi:hypothetical protein
MAAIEAHGLQNVRAERDIGTDELVDFLGPVIIFGDGGSMDCAIDLVVFIGAANRLIASVEYRHG